MENELDVAMQQKIEKTEKIVTEKNNSGRMNGFFTLVSDNWSTFSDFKREELGRIIQELDYEASQRMSVEEYNEFTNTVMDSVKEYLIG